MIVQYYSKNNLFDQSSLLLLVLVQGTKHGGEVASGYLVAKRHTCSTIDGSVH